MLRSECPVQVDRDSIWVFSFEPPPSSLACVHWEVLFLILPFSRHAESFLATAPVEVLLSFGHMQWMFLPAAQQEVSRYLRGSPLPHLRGSILSNPKREFTTSPPHLPSHSPPPLALAIPDTFCISNPYTHRLVFLSLSLSVSSNNEKKEICVRFFSFCRGDMLKVLIQGRFAPFWTELNRECLFKFQLSLKYQMGNKNIQHS